MKPIKFKECNVVYGAQQPEYFPLHAWRRLGDEGELTFAWKLSLWERLRVLFTGTIWHGVLTFNKALQPQLMSTRKPKL